MTTVRALAKLTVSLRITGIRDDGYHLLDAEMVTLDLADELSFGPGDGIEVHGPLAAGVPTDDTNLVAKALRVVGRRAHVRIDKHIRPGGGLGGGSADAAAVLRWAGVHDPLVAARIGSDVPFALLGGRARVTGVGEIVEPLAFEPREYTVVTPPFGVSTVACFHEWDRLGGPTGDHHNDLEPAACSLEPRLVDWRSRVTDICGQRPRLAGSGSTLFVVGAHPELVTGLPDASVVVTRTDRHTP